MKSQAICAALTVLIAFPAGLIAQQAGFPVGVGSGPGVVGTRPANRDPGTGIIPPRVTAFPQPGKAVTRGGIIPVPALKVLDGSIEI